jgi:hypothetical protein
MKMMKLLFVGLVCAPSITGFSLSYEPNVRTRATGSDVTALGGLSFSRVDYEIESVSDELDRKVLWLSMGADVAPQVRAYGFLNLSLDAEWDKSNTEGQGYSFGGGLISQVHQAGPWTWSAFGNLSLVDEKYKKDDFKSKLSLMEIGVGASGCYKTNGVLDPFFGLTVFPYSKGKLKFDAGGSADVERDDVFNIFAGLVMQLNQITVIPQISVGSEQTFGIAVEKKF